jgi:G3E family GTPase
LAEKHPDGMKSKDPIPVTVLTGFLGAGKTTLLNSLLSQKHGYRCAIIINEFGAISVDNQLVVGADEEIVELNNGCLCCRVRGDLIKSLANLFQKQKRFDYVLIETTGLADPGPVAQTFFMPELSPKLRLDGVVTVADAKHLEKELSDAPEASLQIAFADVILLNKTDLVTDSELEHLEARIRRINSLAKIHRTKNSQIAVEKLLNIRARDLTSVLSLSESTPPKRANSASDDHHDHAQHGETDEPEADGHGEHHEHHHHHDDDVKSFYLSEEQPLDLKKVEAWLSEVINSMGPQLYRAKGILHIKGQPKRVVFQGVQMMFDATPDRFWKTGEKRINQLVFIGKELDEAKIRSGLGNCLAG